MNTQVVRPPSPPSPPSRKRRTLDALRPVMMAAALVGVLVLAALLVAWLTGTSSPTPNAFTLTVLKPTGGTLTGSGITCGTGGTTCSTSVKDGQEVDLRAEADEGYIFAGYLLDCAPSGRLEMKAAHSCGARFDPRDGPARPDPGGRRWPLTLTPPENGTIVTLEGHECGTKKKACTAEVQEGTIVSLEVMPEDGYRVQSYTGDCIDGTANMTQPRSCGVVLVKGEGPSVVPTRPPAPPPSPGSPRVTSNSPSGDNTPSKPGSPTAVPTTPLVNAPPVTAGSPSGGPKTPDPTVAGQGPKSTSNVPPAPEPPKPVGDREGDRKKAEETANADIQRVLKAYRAAYERMDIPAMKRIQPGINAAVHDLQFRDAKSVKYTFGGDPQIEDLDVERGTARALVELKTENEQKSGKKQKPLEGKATYLLKRIGESKDWEIVEVKYAMSPK